MEELNRYSGMFEYDYWANSATLASLRTMPGDVEKPRKIFNHVIGAQRVWLARFADPAPPAAQPWPDLTLEECSSAIEDLRRRWRDFLDNLNPEKLGGYLSYRTTKGIEHRTLIQDVLTHLILHSAYHRGQVAAAVREAGGKPASTDYVVYLRMQERK